jgi:hypothetical protein
VEDSLETEKASDFVVKDGEGLIWIFILEFIFNVDDFGYGNDEDEFDGYYDEAEEAEEDRPKKKSKKRVTSTPKKKGVLNSDTTVKKKTNQTQMEPALQRITDVIGKSNSIFLISPLTLI